MGIFFLVKGCILVLEHPPYVSARTGIVKILLQPRKAEVQQFRNDGKMAPYLFCQRVLLQSCVLTHKAALGDYEGELQRSAKKQSVQVSNINFQFTPMGMCLHHTHRISPHGHLAFLRVCNGYSCASPDFCCPCGAQGSHTQGRELTSK